MNAGNVGNPLLDMAYDRFYPVRPVFQRFEVDLDASGIQGRIDAIDPDKGRQAGNVRILEYRTCHGLLPFGHSLEGDRLVRFGNALDHARVFYREEAFGNHHIEQYRQHQCAECHLQGQALTFKHPL